MKYDEKNARQKTTAFFKDFPTLTYPEGKDVVLWGDTPETVYFLEAGHVRQYDINADTGKSVTVHIFNPGSFFPLLWALVPNPSRFFYSAMTECVFRQAPAEAVTHFLLTNPDAALLLTSRLMRGLNGLSQRLKLLTLGDARQQVLSELLYLAKHFGQKQDGVVVILHEFTHQQIAYLTGLARETVSHVLEEATKEGLITRQDHHIILKDIVRLQQEIPR